MKPGSVGAMYDALVALEARRRGDDAYPVHKRLCSHGAPHIDIYDWVADRLRLGEAERVLDLGCGVGFGTIRLAERGAAHVTGMSISREEISRAHQASSRSTRSADIDVVWGSFDRLPREAYDVVVAVESLKHSADIGVTLRAILDSMAPGGRAVFVEDVFVGDPGRPAATRVVEDWMLTKLYTEVDYIAGLAGTGCRVVDLTSRVCRKSRWVLTAQLGILNAALLWRGASHAPGLRAFRGGLYLERLYASGAMRYKAFFLSKDSPGRH